MYTMLIVDDEQASRQGISLYFPWSEHGIDIIGQAKDGLDAKKFISVRRPDIVLTDVKMPYMDGIELASYIRSEFHDIKIIFISGYDDLDYIKAAMKLDAKDYIIKPVDFSELSEVLKKVVDELDVERQYNHKMERINKKIDLSIPLLKDKLFLDLLLMNKCPQNVIDSILEITEMQITVQTYFCVLIISMDDQYDTSDHEKGQIRLTESLFSICKNYPCERDCSIHYLELNGGNVASIIYPLTENDIPFIKNLAEDIRKHISGVINATVSIAVSGLAAGISSIHDLYLKASKALEQRLTLGGNRVIIFDDKQITHPKAIRALQWEERLNKMLLSGDTNETDGFIEEFWDNYIKTGTLEMSTCQQICKEIFYMSRRNIQGSLTHGFDMEITEMENTILQMNTIGAIKKHLKNYFIMISSYIKEYIKNPSAGVVAQVCKLIQQKYAENLTVQYIADKLYLSAPYLCTVFKREMGFTINEYLARTRIEKSKGLLNDPRYKLYEISNAVGYQDPAYFTKQFKKYTGCTPTEFRSINTEIV